MTITHTAALAVLLALGATPVLADTTVYQFAGTYHVVEGGKALSLGYTGSFTMADPAVTTTRPAHAPDVGLPAYQGIWAGDSTFYTGGAHLEIVFANGAQVRADLLDTVVNNTTISEAGAPYPLGQSVQIHTRGSTTLGMTASRVCPDGSIDDACDDSGDDPLYRLGDASDLAVQRITGVYFAFYNAPLSTVAAGVPDLATTFGPQGGGLGIYSANAFGLTTTTLTQFSALSSVTTPSPVPEPASWMMGLAGLALLGLRRRAG